MDRFKSFYLTRAEQRGDGHCNWAEILNDWIHTEQPKEIVETTMQSASDGGLHVLVRYHAK
jgi:hypothetical protein